jgi:CTP synthase (UTP-ammonia lyase)
VFPGFFEFCATHSISVLGICYGMQLIVKQLGGTVEAAAKREYGRMPIHTVQGSKLFGDVTDHTQVGDPSTPPLCPCALVSRAAFAAAGGAPRVGQPGWRVKVSHCVSRLSSGG